MKMLKIREYSHMELKADIKMLLEKYPFLQSKIIGYSALKRPIYALVLGGNNPESKVHFNASHHGLESMTSWVLMNYISDLCHAFESGESLLDQDIRSMLDRCRIYFVPMVNPDGVGIALASAKWQSNARGVDINHNYPANWKPIFDKPHWTRYGGSTPASEPETRAMMKFTQREKFSRVFALHSQGEEIYWEFNGIGDKELAEKMAEASGYKVATPEPLASFGGYKDWFIQEFERPGFTIELGLGENPLPLDEFKQIYEKALPMFLVGSGLCI